MFHDDAIIKFVSSNNAASQSIVGMISEYIVPSVLYGTTTKKSPSDSEMAFLHLKYSLVTLTENQNKLQFEANGLLTESLRLKVLNCVRI